MNMDNNIQRSLGRIEGKLESLCSQIEKRNEFIDKSLQETNHQVNLLQSFRDNFQGRISIIGGIAGVLGALITIFMDKYIR